MRRLFFVFFILTLSISIKGQPITNQEDNAILQRFYVYSSQEKIETLSVGKRISAIAHFFVGTPYVGGLLDKGSKEQLVVDLREMDCVTFVDQVLALAMSKGSSDPNDFVQNLKKLRYRGGIVSYTERLHYSTDWLWEMSRCGILSDVTQVCGGEKLHKEINYMSTHADRYPRLEQDVGAVVLISEIENMMSKRECFYIPKDKMSTASSMIRDGDILLFTTTIKGLDTSHVGIAVRNGGSLVLAHASSKDKMVVKTSETLIQYLGGITKINGVIVARLNEM